jgi:ATP-dependent Clp protease ATP-binding subunit ClpC
LRENIERDLKQTFRPEFLNRIDEVIIFHSLTQEHVKAIVNLQMAEISGRLAEHDLKIELSEAARDWLAQEGYDPQFGARPVRRTLERYVENPLAKRLLAGEFKDGDTVVVDTAADEDGQVQLTFVNRPPEPIVVELPMTHQFNGQEVNG